MLPTQPQLNIRRSELSSWKLLWPYRRNVDVPAGGMYDINLQKPPFNLRPAPLEVIEEKTADKKVMC